MKIKICWTMNNKNPSPRCAEAVFLCRNVENCQTVELDGDLRGIYLGKKRLMELNISWQEDEKRITQ